MIIYDNNMAIDPCSGGIKRIDLCYLQHVYWQSVLIYALIGGTHINCFINSEMI